MRYGICAGVESCSIISDAGYDYIELSVAGDLNPDISDADWLPMQRKIEQMPLVPEAFNSFVRSGHIVGEDVDEERLKRYVSTALARASEVGGSIIVFGSGGARQIPEGYSLEMAHLQIVRFLQICADASEKTGVTVVIEPLCSKECNNINLVSEGAKLAREINRQGVRNLADTYHMEMEGEPLLSIEESADVLAHVHTADTKRLAPGTGTYDHTELFRSLARANYSNRISIECNWENALPERAYSALQHLKACNEGSTA